MSESEVAGASEEPESQQDEDDGSRTPQAAATSAEAPAHPQHTPQSITSTSPSGASETRRRPSLARRLSTATQQRVSCPYLSCTLADGFLAAVQ